MEGIPIPETGALVRLVRPRHLSAEEFRDLMQRAQMRTKALAILLGLQESTVSNWRRGHVPVPGHVIAYLDLVLLAQRAGIAFEAGERPGPRNA